MLLNKSVASLAVPVSIIAALLISTLGTTTVHAAESTYDFQACLAKWKKVKNVDKLREKAINPAVQNRMAKIEDLKTKLDKLTPEHAAAVTNALNADAATLSDLKGKSAKETNATKLQENYCLILFKVQIFSFRAKQVSYMRYSDSRLKRAAALQNVLNNQRNTNIKNIPLKADIEERLNGARAAINTVVAETAAASNAVLAAKVDESNNYSTRSLQKPTFNGQDVEALYQQAYTLYTEANVLRKASNQLIKQEKDKKKLGTAKVEAVSLADEAGADAKKKAKDAKKAKVKYKEGTVTKKEQNLGRKDVKSNWEDELGGGEG